MARLPIGQEPVDHVVEQEEGLLARGLPAAVFRDNGLADLPQGLLFNTGPTGIERAVEMKHPRGLKVGSELGERGLEELREVCAALAAAGISESRVVFDPKVARGSAGYLVFVRCCQGGLKRSP